MTEIDSRKTVALVLGSGGARGYAHVGAIEILQERGYRIIAISGCSMGALVGGIYAAGKLREFKDWATGLDRFDILRLLDVSFSAAGAMRGEKVFSVVNDLLGDLNIEDLPIPYTAVATDLLRQKEVWFQEGPLHQAIRASVAIPSLLTPEMLKGRVLVDGGLLNPLPIIPTISAHADLIVAVNLSHYDASFEDRFFKTVEVKEDRSFEDWISQVWERAAMLFDKDANADIQESLKEDPIARVAQKNRKGVADGSSPPDSIADDSSASQDSSDQIQKSLVLGKFDAMNMAFEAMQSCLTQYKLAGYPPDILINIPKGVCKTFDYHKAPELIQLGREITAATLDEHEAAERSRQEQKSS